MPATETEYTFRFGPVTFDISAYSRAKAVKKLKEDVGNGSLEIGHIMGTNSMTGVYLHLKAEDISEANIVEEYNAERERANRVKQAAAASRGGATQAPATPVASGTAEVPAADDQGLGPVATVVVQLSDGGMIEAVCADQRVRVITVDYMIDDDRDAVEAPDGEMAEVQAVLLSPDPDQTAGYMQAAGTGAQEASP